MGPRLLERRAGFGILESCIYFFSAHSGRTRRPDRRIMDSAGNHRRQEKNMAGQTAAKP